MLRYAVLLGSLTWVAAAQNGLLVEDNEAHPLRAGIESFLSRQQTAKGFHPTGLAPRDYLEVIDKQIAGMRRYQDADGRIIDPVIRKEFAFATPCFAHAAAVLLGSGLGTQPGLLDSAMRAMDAATADMAAGTAPDQHGDFFTYPVMLSLEHFRKVAPPDRVAKWQERLRQVEPLKLYKSNKPGGNNWNIVNAAGEYLRFSGAMTSMEYFEACLRAHLTDFTPLGMFNENGNPLAYDHFSRYFLSGILHLGYRGESFRAYRDLVWRGAWTSLFLQSPFGELPAGYRSAHHIWNEAEAAAMYEVYAREFARAGRRAEAGAFRRAAMLSLSSIRRWIRPDGTGYIVKNRYPIEARFGYEVYSQHTTYNLLACSMLAAAWTFADPTIAETPSPADVGGYVIPVLEPFHKVFAAAGNAYVEYDTRGDHIYDPTGLIRIHIRGGNPQLGPSSGCAPKFSGEGVNVAVGPAWKDAGGVWRSLADMSPEHVRVEVLREAADEAAFRVTFNGLPGGVNLVETVTVRDGGVTLESVLSGGGVTAMRMSFPLLRNDGAEEARVRVRGNTLHAHLRDGGVRFTAVEPAGAAVTGSGKLLKHRNGMVEPFQSEAAGIRMVSRITAQ